MNGLVKVFDREPSNCNANELADFKALVLAGGEVAAQGIEDRIRTASRLVFLSVGCCLRGIAALKRPLQNYRKEVSVKSGIPLSEEEYPFELGWVFVMPSARGRRFSLDLTRAALAAADGRGIFATSRTDNIGMHATLARCRFLPVGRPYPSARGKYQLQLFIRNPIQLGRADAPHVGGTQTTRPDAKMRKGHLDA